MEVVNLKFLWETKIKKEQLKEPIKEQLLLEKRVEENNLTELNPDLTLFFDCPIEIGLTRAKNRAKLDRFEDEELSFHERIYNQYHKLYKEHPDRIVKIEAFKGDELIRES